MKREIQDITWRKLVTQIGARDETYGPKLTMDLSRASVIRDPQTGKLMARETEVFRKWRACLAS